MHKFAFAYLANHCFRFLPSAISERCIKPVLVEWKITYRCNLRCPHCVYWQLPVDNELNTNASLNGIQKLKEWLGVFCLSLYGGEPFLRSDLATIANYATGFDIPVTITTNGTINYKPFLERLTKKDSISLNISLDGISPEVHERFRDKGVYAKVMDNLKFVKDHFRVKVFTTIMDHNLDELCLLAQFANDESIPLSFQALTAPLGKSIEQNWHKEDPLWPKDTEKVTKVLDRIIHLKKKGSRIYNSLAHLNQMRAYFLNPERYGNGRLCKARFENLSILPNGDIKICVYKGCIGNVARDSLMELWRCPKTINIRRQMRECKRSCSILRCYFNDTLRHKIRSGFAAYRHRRRMISNLKKNAEPKESIPDKCIRLFWSLHSVISEIGWMRTRKVFLKKMRRAFLFLYRENNNLQLHSDSTKENTLILIGGGPLPYTALFYRKEFSHVIVVEKNILIAHIASWSTRKRANVTIIHSDGKDFSFPKSSLVIISLLTKGKLDVFKKAINNGVSRICIRLPVAKIHSRYESLSGYSLLHSYKDDSFSVNSVVVINK